MSDSPPFLPSSPLIHGKRAGSLVNCNLSIQIAITTAKFQQLIAINWTTSLFVNYSFVKYVK